MAEFWYQKESFRYGMVMEMILSFVHIARPSILSGFTISKPLNMHISDTFAVIELTLSVNWLRRTGGKHKIHIFYWKAHLEPRG